MSKPAAVQNFDFALFILRFSIKETVYTNYKIPLPKMLTILINHSIPGVYEVLTI